MNPFEFVKCINESSEIPFSKEEIEQFYNPYITIAYLSKFEDSIFIANELNCFKKDISKYEHFIYLHSLIRKRKRFYKKSEKKDSKTEENIKVVMEYFEYGREKAKEALKILKPEEVKKIKKFFEEKDKPIIKN